MDTNMRWQHAARRILIGGMTALTLVGASSNALAGSPSSALRHVTVRYSELDLSRPAGAQVLYQRLRLAAFDVCDNFAGSFSTRRLAASTCYENALAKAVQDVNSPQLSAIYRAHLVRVANQ